MVLAAGVQAAGQELNVGLFRQVVDHIRAVREIRLPVTACIVIADQRVEIPGGIFRRVFKPRIAAWPVARYPKRSGGCRAGAADLVGFLADDDIEPFDRRNKRRRHTPGPSSGNQQVRFDIPILISHHFVSYHSRCLIEQG